MNEAKVSLNHTFFHHLHPLRKHKSGSGDQIFLFLIKRIKRYGTGVQWDRRWEVIVYYKV